MRMAEAFIRFQREMDYIVKQNPIECELYSIIAEIMRTRKNSNEISLRDVSALKNIPGNGINAEDRQYKTKNQTTGSTDFLIIDPSYRYSERKTDKILGCIEVKAVYTDLDREIDSNKVQFDSALRTFKKLIYTNGLEWRIYWDEKEKPKWEVKLGEYCLTGKDGEVTDSDYIKWNEAGKWKELLEKLDQIDWFQRQ